MDSPDKTFAELVGLLKSWTPWRSEPPGVSRDFWMPDQSCMVCYECDSQFTVFNRRHHCRLCGRVFCAKCTSNTVPVPSGVSSTAREEWERIRVCNYCFKHKQQGIASFDDGIQVASLDLNNSSSVGSFASTKSSGTANSSSFTPGSVPYSVGPYQQTQYSSSGPATQHTEKMDNGADNPEEGVSGRSNVADVCYKSSDQYAFSMNRSDDDEDEYNLYQYDSETRHFLQVNNCYHQFDDVTHDGLRKAHLDGEAMDLKSLSSSPINHGFGPQGLEGIRHVDSKYEQDMDDEGEATSSMYPGENGEAEPVDIENNAVLWLPPEPEDEEDERDGGLFDDDDDDEGNVAGEWGCLRSSSSFGSGEFRNRDRSTEEHKQAMKNVVDGHFRALVAQLLQVENVPIVDEDGKESWLDIITSLSWEAATLLKPDMSKGGGMDPGGYVKVKCVACGHRSESMVIKGVVCKKNVAHRRMISKIEKPRLLILGGALEYQRVSNHLSSFDTLLQQEMDYLKMAVAKIDAHRPNILLVEKSVSRFAQDYLLTKDISLVLNIKRPLLERIASCTGAQIIPSIDHLSSPKLGYCETFHVERFLEHLGSAGQGGKKLVKTLMYFDGCPKPFGFTILLRGANGDELKKVKHVVQYGVFAAYHLALETSFLADEGASLPELPLNSPITVALPDKPLSIERSITTVPGCMVCDNKKSQRPISEPQRASSDHTTFLPSIVASNNKVEREPMTSGSRSQSLESTSHNNASVFLSDFPSKGAVALYSDFTLEKEDRIGSKGSFDPGMAFVQNGSGSVGDKFTVDGFRTLDDVVANTAQTDLGEALATHLHSSEVLSPRQDVNSNTEVPPLKEEFPPSPSDHRSILVSLSSRCVWKGTVCERSHLFRIKYYGNFDKPLGRFLRDHLFNQDYTCHTCEMPSEAHVHCYTHRQGTLTISVKKLPEMLLPGEKDGKIWMWHRCLKCPRTNNFPPATRRVVMSDAAWGLSFGKFLELSFSNHAAASRVASCGHSLHRDCLRFYGFGKMVACFRYASIDVLSVHIPPPKLDFNCNKQDWIQKEINELVERAELLFSEVLNALSQMAEKRFSGNPLNNAIKISESRRQIAELEALLQKEKAEFEESLQKTLNREGKKGPPTVDILDVNRLRRQLLFLSYMWDHRLIYVAGLVSNGLQDSSNGLATGHEEKAMANNEKLSEMNMTDITSEDLSNSDSLKQLNCNEQQGGFGGAADHSGSVDEETDMGLESNHGRDNQYSRSIATSISDQSEQLEFSESVHSTTSMGQVSIMVNLSDTLDAAWTGESNQVMGISKDNASSCMDSAAIDCLTTAPKMDSLDLENHLENHNGAKVNDSLATESSIKGPDIVEDSVSWLKMPFLSFYRSFNKNLLATPEKLYTFGNYNTVYVSSFQELELQSGARMLLPVGVNDTVIPVYDDEPTSIISYALISPEYHGQIINEGERLKDNGDLSYSLNSFESLTTPSVHSVEDVISGSLRSLPSTDESVSSISGSHSSLIVDPVSYTKAMHARVSFGDDGPLGKVRYSVTCHYAKRFEALRKICCPSELDFIRSLSRCKKWGAQGGKSNVFFAKTLDDRFIIKQVTKTELESFIKFAPEYFKFLSESISSGSPTCLAKILGIYQVTTKHLKGGKESKMDLLVMENLLFERNVARLYDLKGSTRSRYNSDSSGSNKVLLDQNLIEAMPTSPIFVGNKAKKLLERAVWNDTSFLASIDVMDYSLLVGVDEEKHELVLGIIDFMRQYTWDKHLETWMKTSGFLGGQKNESPTVISPQQYKKRFRKAMTTYFLMVPDQWSPPSIIPSISQSELCKENTQDGNLVE